MLKITVEGSRRSMNGLERELDRIIGRIGQDTIDVARKNTPIDKGQARRGWRLRTRRKGFSVVNSVSYIDELEKGRSKQAPRGILGPTVREISKRRYK